MWLHHHRDIDRLRGVDGAIGGKCERAGIGTWKQALALDVDRQ